MLDPTSSLAEGRRSYAASDWSGALAQLSAAREQASLDAEDIATLARAAWWLGRVPEALAFAERLAAGWTLARLDRTMLQILRAGTYELLARADVPTGTVIGEYLDVAHAFFDPREAKFVNGVLDAVAKGVRA